jgi:hypothetical protein
MFHLQLLSEFPSLGLEQLNGEQVTISGVILTGASGRQKRQMVGYWNQSLGSIGTPPIGGWLD